MKIFDRHTIHEYPLSELKTTDDFLVYHYFHALITQGTKQFFQNVDSEVLLAQVGQRPISVTLSFTPENCYVCSPYAHYITYALAEVSALNRPRLQALLRLLIMPLAWTLQWGKIDHVVYINNWFLSTNLYEEIPPADYLELITTIKQRFPDRAILFRSLNDYTPVSRELLKTLKSLPELGQQLVLSRQVYITDPAHPHYRRKKDFKSDLKLLQQTPYKVVHGRDLAPEDYPRIIELYHKLYLQKYTPLNPQFTPELLRLMIEQDLFTVKVLKLGPRIDGVLGYYQRGGVMTTPLFGFDTDLPAETGLYRLLSTLLVLDSEEKKIILNQSSGASGFKRTRGARPHLEYTLVLAGHLPWWRRWVWHGLRILLKAIAVPLLQKLQL